MPVAKAVEDILAAWREAERVLDTLPPLSPDHESVRRVVVDLRLTYQVVTSSAAHTSGVIERTHQTLAETHVLLARIKRGSEAQHP